MRRLAVLAMVFVFLAGGTSALTGCRFGSREGSDNAAEKDKGSEEISVIPKDFNTNTDIVKRSENETTATSDEQVKPKPETVDAERKFTAQEENWIRESIDLVRDYFQRHGYPCKPMSMDMVRASRPDGLHNGRYKDGMVYLALSSYSVGNFREYSSVKPDQIGYVAAHEFIHYQTSQLIEQMPSFWLETLTEHITDDIEKETNWASHISGYWLEGRLLDIIVGYVATLRGKTASETKRQMVDYYARGEASDLQQFVDGAFGQEVFQKMYGTLRQNAEFLKNIAKTKGLDVRELDSLISIAK
ncbi:MAG: hypothetical protein WC449_02975 [Candidatus Paceibacterota bacterium]